MQKPWDILKDIDREVYQLIEKELMRQEQGLELIASENFASPAVIAAMGNVMTNKYAEGLPGKRYYGGCEVVDSVEQLAIERAKNLFGSCFVNVQPHSGAQANAAVFLALLKPGDKVLGLDLSHGGHLTHGSKVNFSGLLYESYFYQLNENTEMLDYDAIYDQAVKIKPRMIIAGASAYPRSIDFKIFKDIAQKVGAYLMVDMAHIAGLVAAGLHDSPVPHADVVTTTTHKTLRGPRGGMILWNNPELNFNKAVFPGVQGGPLEHIIAAKAVCFKEALQPEFKNYQKQVIKNAQALASGLLEKGLKLVSGGTDNHLLLLSLLGTSVTGKQLEQALGAVHITVNKNTVPREVLSPFVTSGVRLGTPAVTTRGFKEDHMHMIANWIYEVFCLCRDEKFDDEATQPIAKAVQSLAQQFPLYRGWVH